MATLPLSPPPKPLPLFSTHRHRRLHLLPLHHPRRRGAPPPPISASASRIPSSPPPSPPGELYQPFRPPPSPLPAQYRSMDTAGRLEVLRNRLGLWYDYAVVIPSLSQEGFTPPSIEEITGISGVEQNRLVVAARVRETLTSSPHLFPADLLPYFDSGGAELLYEIRFLNAAQRAAAARRIVDRRLDAKAAQEMSRAVKDFPRRRGEIGWECFSAASPADCLAYTYFRLSREAIADTDRAAALAHALEAAETDAAKKRIEREMKGEKDGKGGGEDDEAVRIRVPVVRMQYGEVAEATSVAVLPVCEAAEGEESVAAAPAVAVEGEFKVVVVVAAAGKGWRRWVALPGWGPVMGIKEGLGLAVAFPDARVLPWRTERSAMEEAVMVVADRGRKVVAEEDGLYLVGGGGGGGTELAVERGRKLLEAGKKEALATVVLVARPPRDDFDDGLLRDEEWD